MSSSVENLMLAVMGNMADKSKQAAIRNRIRLEIEEERVKQVRSTIQKKKRQEINKRGFKIKGHTLNNSKFSVSKSEIEDRLRKMPPVSNSEIANRIGLQARRAALARAKANPVVLNYAYSPDKKKHTTRGSSKKHTTHGPSKLSKGRKTRKGTRKEREKERERDSN